MVNKLLQNANHPVGGRVQIRYIGETQNLIGSVTYTFGTIGWMSWATAKYYRNEGLIEILEYEESLVESYRQKIAESADPVSEFMDESEIPAFLCPECLDNDIFKLFGTFAKMKGHVGSHRVGHGWTKGQPRDPAKRKAYDKEQKAIARKERDRIYNTEYQRKKRHGVPKGQRGTT